jgi:hypothetical protein
MVMAGVTCTGAYAVIIGGSLAVFEHMQRVGRDQRPDPRVALAAHAVSDEFAAYREIGGVIGTSASALFLFMIAIANLVVLRGVYRAFRKVKRGELVREEDIDAVLQQRGWLARLFRPPALATARPRRGHRSR